VHATWWWCEVIWCCWLKMATVRLQGDNPCNGTQQHSFADDFFKMAGNIDYCIRHCPFRDTTTGFADTQHG